MQSISRLAATDSKQNLQTILFQGVWTDAACTHVWTDAACTHVWTGAAWTHVWTDAAWTHLFKALGSQNLPQQVIVDLTVRTCAAAALRRDEAPKTRTTTYMQQRSTFGRKNVGVRFPLSKVSFNIY